MRQLLTLLLIALVGLVASPSFAEDIDVLEAKLKKFAVPEFPHSTLMSRAKALCRCGDSDAVGVLLQSTTSPTFPTLVLLCGVPQFVGETFALRFCRPFEIVK
jgi:hypothetical protein